VGGASGARNEVAQLQRGDLDALSALLARYQNRLYRYLLRLVREPAEAEDLFQQTWVRVAEKIRQYDRSAISKLGFSPWREIWRSTFAPYPPGSLDEPIAGTPGDLQPPVGVG